MRSPSHFLKTGPFLSGCRPDLCHGTQLWSCLRQATKRRRQSTPEASTSTRPQTSWVSEFAGLVELAQALFESFPSDASLSGRKSPRRKRGSDGAHAAPATLDNASACWSGIGPVALARPLFDALPELLAVVRSGVADKAMTDAVAAAEYALWLTMDVLAALLRRLSVEPSSGKRKAEPCYDGRRAGKDAERVLNCITEDPSPQTRFGVCSDFFSCRA